jgi:hypothetical protein
MPFTTMLMVVAIAAHRTLCESVGVSSALLAERQLLRSFNPGVICGHDSVTSSRYVEARAGGTMPTIIQTSFKLWD